MATRKFLVNIDLDQNSLINTVIENRDSVIDGYPSTPVAGQIFYDENASNKKPFYYDGTTWVAMSSATASSVPFSGVTTGTNTTATMTVGTGASLTVSGSGTINANLYNSNAIIALADGGTNANLTAVNGGILYSTASALAITSVGVSGQLLQSGGAGAPTWISVASLAIDHGGLTGLSDDDHTQYIHITPGSSSRNTIAPTVADVVPLIVKQSSGTFSSAHNVFTVQTNGGTDIVNVYRSATSTYVLRLNTNTGSGGTVGYIKMDSNSGRVTGYINTSSSSGANGGYISTFASGTSKGGDIKTYAGTASTSQGGTGGDIGLYGGAGSTAAGGNSGYINLYGGAGGTVSGGTGGTGGYITAIGAAGTTSGTGVANANAGYINLNAGTGSNTGTTNARGGHGGAFISVGGNATNLGQGGAGGILDISGGSTSVGGAGGDGGSITLKGGIATGSTGGNAGSINLSGGDNSNFFGNGGTGGSVNMIGAASTPGITGGNAGSLTTSGSTQGYNGGSINTSGGSSAAGGSVTTSNGGGSIDTTGNGSIQFGIAANRITVQGVSSAGGKTLTLPNLTGTVIGAASTSVTDTNIVMATTTAGGIKFVALSGDATISNTGSLTIANNAVTLAKFQQIATASFLGRSTAGTGNVEVLSVSTVRTLLSISNVEDTALSTWAGSTNLITLGTVTNGTWNGSLISPVYGGTGVANNVASTLTISGNFATTFTISGITSVTLPTSGTLATLAGSESLTNKKLGSLTSNGFVKTSGGDGTLSVDTNTYLTGNQTITLSGDVSGSGTTAITTTIANSAVTFAKMQDISTGVVLGRSTASTGNIEQITVQSPLTISGGNLDFDETATLGNNARVAVSKNSGATVGTRRRINFIEGTNISLTVSDDSGNEEVDVTIAASGDLPGNIAYLDVAQTFTASQIFRPTNSSSIGLVVRGVASQSASLQEWQTSTPTTVSSVSANGDWTIAPIARSSGTPTGLTFTGAAHTTLGGEATDINFNLARTVNTSSSVTHWRAFRIQGPTVSYTVPQSVTQLSTLAVSAPTASPTGTGFPTSGIWAINVESGGMKISPGNISFASNSSTHTIFNISASGNTAGNISTGSTNNDVLFDLSRTVTWSTTTPSTNSSFRIVAPTYASTSTATMTHAATLAISGAPTAGTNLTITNRYAIYVESGQVAVPAGSNSAPSYSIYNDTNTGMYSNGADTLDFTTGGTNRLRLDSSGNILVNSASAVGRISVAHSTNTSGISFQAGTATWAIWLGSESVPYFYIAGSGATSQYFWRANWNATSDAGNTFKSASDTANQVVMEVRGASAQTAILQQWTRAGTLVSNINSHGDWTINPAVRTTGSPNALLVTGAAHTTLTASAEASDIYFNLARTVQFAAGSLSTQRAIRISAPTYAFASASTLSDASTVAISGAPAAGTNATITRSYALSIESGAIALRNEGGLHMFESIGLGTNKIVFKAASDLISDSTYSWPVLPAATPVGAGQYVLTGNDGFLAWTALSNAQLGTQVYNEVPSGTVNGSNAGFTVANGIETGTLRVYKNGLRQKPGSGYDYTLSGSTITFESGNIPQTGDVLLVDYVTDGMLA